MLLLSSSVNHGNRIHVRLQHDPQIQALFALLPLSQSMHMSLLWRISGSPGWGPTSQHVCFATLPSSCEVITYELRVEEADRPHVTVTAEPDQNKKPAEGSSKQTGQHEVQTPEKGFLTWFYLCIFYWNKCLIIKCITNVAEWNEQVEGMTASLHLHFSSSALKPSHTEPHVECFHVWRGAMNTLAALPAAFEGS